jgi:hypothetical protein
MLGAVLPLGATVGCARTAGREACADKRVGLLAGVVTFTLLGTSMWFGSVPANASSADPTATGQGSAASHFHALTGNASAGRTSTGGASAGPMQTSLATGGLAAQGMPQDVSYGFSDDLNGIACPSANDCWGVGSYQGIANYATFTLTTDLTLVERNTGGYWTHVASPSPNKSGNSLAGVTCVDAVDCWAVGSQGASGAGSTLIEHYGGSAWTLVSSQNAAGTHDYLYSVSCPTSADCWAVGEADGSSADTTLIERYNGTSWSLVPSPNVTSDQFLASVTCFGIYECWAVGASTTSASSGAWSTLIEEDTGSGWAIVTSPDPSPASPPFDGLQGVTCMAADDCWAVGAFTEGTGALPVGLTVHYDGSSWQWTGTLYRPPILPTLYSVSCLTDDRCFAIGSYGDLAEYSGSAWQAPFFGGLDGTTRYSISCGGGVICWGVGTESGPRDTAFAEQVFAPQTVGDPVPVVTPGGGQELLFWRGPADSHLDEAWYSFATGAWSGPVDLSTLLGIPSGGALASNPTVTFTPDGGQQLVFWEGADQDLWEVWYSYKFSNWQVQDLSAARSLAGAGGVGSVPSVTFTPGGGQQLVFWEGTDQDLWEAWYSVQFSLWQSRDLSTTYLAGTGATGSLASAPSVILTPHGGQQLVFWRGTTNHVWEAWYSVQYSLWQVQDLSQSHAFPAAGDIASRPTVILTPGGGQQLLFWQAASTDHLYEAWYSVAYSTWASQDLSTAQLGGTGSVASPPVATVTPSGGQQLVFWQTASDHLDEAWYSVASAGWAAQDLWSANNVPSTATLAAPPGVVVYGDGVQELWWQGAAYQELWELYFDPSVNMWTACDWSTDCLTS